MDSKHLSRFLYRKGEFFNTSVDDYLYITPNPRLAAKFLDKMEIGYPSYNCKFNSTKISTNIYPKIGWPLPLQNCEWVTFCGWCFCLTCGHIMRDFGTYAGQDMASSLSFIPRNVTSPERYFFKLKETIYFFIQLNEFNFFLVLILSQLFNWQNESDATCSTPTIFARSHDQLSF
jgi:hypothetical protein